jgi:hypothetical protein
MDVGKGSGEGVDDEDKKTALDKGSAGLCRRKEVEGAR